MQKKKNLSNEGCTQLVLHSSGFLNLQDAKLMCWNVFFYTLKERAMLANSSFNASWVKTRLHLLFWHQLSFTLFAWANTAGLYSNDVSIDVFLNVISYFSINCFHSCLLHQCLSIYVLSHLAFDKKFPSFFCCCFFSQWGYSAYSNQCSHKWPSLHIS